MNAMPRKIEATSETPRLAFSISEAADLLGVNYFSVYRLVQRGKLRSNRALRKHLIPKSELVRFIEAGE